MSRTSLHRPRRPRAVSDRPAPGTRLLPYPFPSTIPLHFPHYKRCPKAHRLRLRSDQSLSLPVHVTGYGRSPDIVRHALSKGRIGAPLPSARSGTHARRTTLALSGRPPEHGVSHRSSEGQRNSPSPDSTVVAFGEAMPHSDGTGATPPYLRMAGHFWWSRLPHTEITSRLLHVLSEARGCRRAGVDVEHPLWRTTPIGTGVAVFLRNRPGPSIPSPSPAPSIQGKADFSRKTIKPHAWVRASIKTPPFIPTKGTAQQPIPQPLPPQLNNRRP